MGVSEVAKLVTMSFRPSVRRGGKNTLLVIAASFIILMMGTLPIVHAFLSSESAHSAAFYRTGCSNLGAFIQNKFGWDISSGNNTNTLTIKEKGQEGGTTLNNGFGAFKFLANPIGLQYPVSGQPEQYPSIQAYANLHKYQIYSVNMTVTEPTSGTSSVTVTHMISTGLASPYSANFSTAKDGMYIQIEQTSTDIIATYLVISSSGTTLQTWTLDQSLSGVSNPPPYSHTAESDEIDGLDAVVSGTHYEGYANVLSGTDFQIESVIQTLATDFTGYQNVLYNGGNNAFSITSCSLSSFVDEEGDNMTIPASGSSQHSNNGVDEAWQYVKVTH
jgi:hypothetical protein